MGLIEEMARLKQESDKEHGIVPEDNNLDQDQDDEIDQGHDSDSDAEKEEDKDNAGDAEHQDDESKKEVIDNAAMARMRREAAAAKREAEEVKRQLELLQNSRPQQREEPTAKKQENTDPEPDKDDVEEHLRWQIRQQSKAVDELRQWKEEQSKSYQEQQQEVKNQEILKRAVQNFNNYEQEFSKQVPDYQEASSFMAKKMVDGAKAAYPFATPEEINAFVQNQILTMADHFAGQKLNPVEELYFIAKERYGFSSDAKEEEKEKKPSISVIAANKKKSISSLSGGSSSKVEITMSGMTPQRLASLSREQRAQLIKEG